MEIPLKAHYKKMFIKVLCSLACILMIGVQTTFAQTAKKEVTGLVVDEKGESVVGASVIVVGSNVGTVTDVDGQFKIKANESSILRINFLGYEPRNIKVGTSSDLKVVLTENEQLLKEVVVTAMGITREAKSLTYATGSVDPESMTESRWTNLTDMLSGKVSGMQVTPGSGPLSSTRVVIRAETSLTGDNRPLFVIDGIPVQNNTGELGELDYGNIVNSMNPDEIENIEVLKGANAAALYGSDGARGVILITTKKATKKKGMGISYGFNMMLGYLYNFPTYQNIYGAGQNNRFQRGYNYYNNSALGSSYDPNLPYGIHRYNLDPSANSWGMPMLGFDVVGRNDEIKPYSPAKSTIENMYQTSTMITNSLSVDKVWTESSLRLSYTNIHSDDILINFNKLNRNVFNLRSTAKLTPFLDMDLGMRYINEQVDNRGFRNESMRNPLYVITGLQRDATIEELIPWKKPDGTPFTRGGEVNPYWLLNETSNADENHWITGNITLNFKLNKLFKLRLKAATDVNSTKNWNFSNLYSSFDVDGYYQRGSNLNTNNNFDALFSYNQRFRKDISISANAGAWMQNIRRDRQLSIVNILAEADKKTLANNAGTMISNEACSKKDKQAVFGMVNFGYKNWLYLDATARNEWSSTLPVQNNSYFYYSYGTGIILSDLVKVNKKILSFAKIRASYAMVGNDTSFDELYNGFNYWGTYLDNTVLSGESTRKNPDLRPEKIYSWEVGTDLRFWDNRLSLDFTYYDKSSRDQIIAADISSVSGYTKQMINAGELSNRGVEITFNLTPVKMKNFTWTTTANWSKNNSKVVALADDIDRFELGNASFITLYAQVGQPYGVFYGNDYRRNEYGQICVDLMGVPLYDPDQYLTSMKPDWLGGWRNSFKFGQIDVNVMLDFQKGGKVWSNTAYQGGVEGSTVQSLEGRYEFLFSDLILGETADERKGIMSPGNTVKPKADSYANSVIYPDKRPKGVYIPNAVYDSSLDEFWRGKDNIAWTPPTNYWRHSNQTSTARYLYDASYIKLREVSMGYNFPKKWLRKISLNDVKLSLVGRNVAILYQKTPKGVDPQATRTAGNAQGFEMGFALPQAYWGFDFKVSF